MRVGCKLPRAAEALSESTGQIALAAEQLGFDSLWTDAHVVVPAEVTSPYPLNAERRHQFGADTPFADPMISLAYAAALTSRIRLATSVIPLLSTDPHTLAKQAATLDALSDGRLELGLGAGWLKEEAVLLGHPTDHPTARLAETIDLLRTAWRDGVFEWHGTFYDVPRAGIIPMPPQRDRIPLWIGGVGESAVRIALEKGAGLVLSFGNLDRGIAVKRRLASSHRSLPIAVSMWLSGAVEKWQTAADEICQSGMDVVIVHPDREERHYPDRLAEFAERVMPRVREGSPR